MLLDEPTNNLDIYHATNLMKMVRKLSDDLGKTVILVLHEINYASFYSDYICAFKDGKLQIRSSRGSCDKRGALRDLPGRFEILRIEGKPLCIYY